MTMLKEFYKGDIPCNDCIHKNVCNVKTCFEETKFETTHPFVDIQIKCTEYQYYGGTKRVNEDIRYRECTNPNIIETQESEEVRWKKISKGYAKCWFCIKDGNAAEKDVWCLSNYGICICEKHMKGMLKEYCKIKGNLYGGRVKCNGNVDR